MADTGNQRIKIDQVTPKTIVNWLINRNINIDEVLPAQLIDRIIKATEIADVSDEELEKVIRQVISENQKAVEDYKKGKDQVMGFLTGQVLRKLKGKGDAQGISVIIKRLV